MGHLVWECLQACCTASGVHGCLQGHCLQGMCAWLLQGCPRYLQGCQMHGYAVLACVFMAWVCELLLCP